MLEEDFVKIRKSYLFFVVIAIVLFVAGFFSSQLFGFLSKSTKVEDCRTFCKLVNAEYNSMKNDHCFCEQERLIYDQTKNQTVTITQTVDVGVIKIIKIEPGLSQEAIDIIQQQQRLLQQQAQ